MWSSYIPGLLEAAKESPYVDLVIFSQKHLEDDVGLIEDFFEAAKKSNLIFFYRTTDNFWQEIDLRLDEIGANKVIISTSFDPTQWGKNSTVDIEICAKAYSYLIEGGKENYKRLLNFLAHQFNPTIPFQDPIPMPWQGIWHPPDKKIYKTVAEYRRVYPPKGYGTVGILFPRNSYINTDGSLEASLIYKLEEKGFDVIPVFSHGTPDKDVGALGPISVCEQYFLDEQKNSRIDALINLQFFFLGRNFGSDTSDLKVASHSIELFKKLNVPVFKPVISYSKSRDEWEEDPQGLVMDVTFGIAMPEFEGNIEPILIACNKKIVNPETNSSFEIREVIEERIEHVVNRISRFVCLAKKPVSKRKIVFVIHKNECAGLEATIGSAAGLDSGESIVRILRRMKELGYRINNIPESGEALMQTILAKKAISEFRWTTVEEIVSKGGYLALLDKNIYQKWFNELPKKAKENIVKAWGYPPGEELNGVPPSMIYNDKLVITGLNLGNVNIIMQPKRGCAGARCDGQVCRILHDPDIPPPHHYIATYMYMDRVFGADVIIHVGTHGNLEWLPGKGAGLSSSCWPDISIGSIPHLYIYNADNPAEGVVAKRRSYAVLIDHLQAIMNTSDTYGELKELEDLLEEYIRASSLDPVRAHQLKHLIKEAIERANIKNEIEAKHPENFNEITRICHEIISRTKNSQTRVGMHIFGHIPDTKSQAELINTILRFDTSNKLNTRRLIFDIWGEDIDLALRSPSSLGKNKKTYSSLLFEADKTAVEYILKIIQGKSPEEIFKEISLRYPKAKDLKDRLLAFHSLVRDIHKKLNKSKEIDALLNAINGGYVEPGPSGYLSRGRYDILPTGRNFYNIDPTRIPTKAAYRVGVKLAEAIIQRYQKDEGRFPETVGMVWLASDIMRSDGEQICQILHLIGARPKWKANGQINGIEVISTKELGRPRVDVNIRVSGITRDCFPDAVKYVDQAIMQIASLDEDPEENFIRKHILELASEENMKISDPYDFRRLCYRIFCAKPGVYRSGVNLAIYASAWKTESDLSDVYLYWNGYAYGAGDSEYGVVAHREFVSNLKHVDITFNKHISDEGDFLDCCGYFSNYGGMSVAAKVLSGKKPRNYYGDTRDPANVDVVDFAEEMRRIVRAKLLNPKFIEGMKAHGYKGAGDLSKKIGRVYGFAATTGEVDGWIFDEITKTFVLNEEMRKWFEDKNPWALEEISRRLLEAESRGIWQPDEELLDKLKEVYLEIEGSIEDTMDGELGEFQGGSVDVMNADDVHTWRENMDLMLKDIKKYRN